MKITELLKEVIPLAEAIREYWDTELPKRHPDYPIVRFGEKSAPPPPEQEKLRKLLLGMPDELIYRLIAIMYLGRGDFGARQLAEQLEEMKETFPKPERAVSQMLAKAPLAEYLTDGLAELQKHHIDPDSIGLESVKA